MPCDCAAAAAAEAVPAPEPEPVDLAFVPLPDDVTSIRFPWYTVDGSRILASASSPGFARRREIASIAEDGSDFRCLTCPLSRPGDPQLGKPFPLADGKRVLVRVGEQSPLAAAEHAVLECEPSVLACDVATLVPLEVPGRDAPEVTQAAREFRVAPDGRHVAFTQIRRRPGDGEVPVMVMGELVREGDRYVVHRARVVGTDGELKAFTRDGQSIFFLSVDPSHSLNFDVFRRDLATGATTRVTRHVEYDEPIDESPDGRWIVVNSARAHDRWGVFTQLPRPAIVDRAVGQRLLSWFLLEDAGAPFLVGDEFMSPWLVDRAGERGDYVGQRLNPGAEDQGARAKAIPNWHPGGTRILFWEAIADEARAPGEPDSRLRIAHLTSRAPVADPIRPGPVPAAAWAPELAGFALAPEPEPERIRAGRVFGAAEIELTAGPLRRLAITYRDFSDDGLTVLNGTEVATWLETDLLQPATWDADVRLSGCRSGSLAIEGLRVAPFELSGRAASEVDGHLIEGLPRR
jgi:hypothetical protein